MKKETTKVVQELNAKYNQKGVFFTEGNWDKIEFEGIKGRQYSEYREVGFPFNDHVMNKTNGIIVPLNIDQNADVIEEAIAKHLKIKE